MPHASWEEAPGGKGSGRVWKLGACNMGGESGSGLKGINNTREQSLIPYETMAKSNEGILSGVRGAKSGIQDQFRGHDAPVTG